MLQGVKTPMRSIERLDVQAHIEGEAVQWEVIEMDLNERNLIWCPLMAPISDTEIAFLRFGQDCYTQKVPGVMTPLTVGGVAVYDVAQNKVTNVASTGLKFATEYNTCITASQGKIVALVSAQNGSKKIVSYSKGDSKIRVFAEDGTEENDHG